MLHQRAAMYMWTRPACALAAIGTGAAAATFNPPAQLSLKRAECSPVERLSALPMAVAGAVGVVAVLQRRGGLSWLAHGYETAAWVCAFGGVSAAAALSAAGVPSTDKLPLLSVSTAGVMAATAGDKPPV